MRGCRGAFSGIVERLGVGGVRDGVPREQAAFAEQRFQVRGCRGAFSGIVERLGVGGVRDGVPREQAAFAEQRFQESDGAPRLAGFRVKACKIANAILVEI